MHFFFFKQKTAYELRISDWSSDVCSSDLRKVRRILADDGWLDPEDNAVAREVLKVEPGFGKHLLNQPPGLECLSECLASPLHRLYQCVDRKSVVLGKSV